MGHGSWDPTVYATTTKAAMASGTTFAYSASIASGAVKAEVHDMLDPQKVAGPGSPLAGQIVREARDSVEHPNSVPIYVSFDETGSMGNVPRVMQTKLAELFTLLLRKGYVEDPQVAVGAYGDAQNYERAPLQVGQFESDNKADETLENIYLEGNGGGNGGESAALTWYYLAFHTSTDAFEKRGKKGYAFTVGDEVPLAVTRDEVIKYIHGGNADVALPFEGQSMSAADVAKAASEKWDLFHLIIDNYAAAGQGSVKVYTKLLGDNAIVLEDYNAVCETIAIIIGTGEGTIDLDEGLDDLKDIGSNAGGAVGKALAKRGAKGGGAVVVSDAPHDLALTDEDDLTRL